MSNARARALSRAAARLAKTPTDLGGWLDVAAEMAAAGKKAEAGKAFAALGEAASELGQVGLAIACVRWLDTEGGDAKLAKQVLDAIVKTHAHGSKRIDRSLKPRPPAPPAAEPDVAEPDEAAATTVDQAVAVAVKAIAGAYEAAMARRQNAVPATPLVSVLEPTDVRRLVAVMKLTRVPAGTAVVDVGQPARALYWIARGAASVTRGDHELGELRSNAFFGEIALVGGTARTARVTCTRRTWLLEIPAASIEKAAEKAPKLARVLARYARARLLSNVMRTSELFSRLDDSERSALLGKLVTELVPDGTRLIEKGSENDRFYVVVQGALEVRDAADKVATLGIGDGVGEMSLLSKKPAVADVIATGDTVVLYATRAQFEEVAVQHPGLLAEVYKLHLEREQENEALVIEADDLIL